MVKPVIVTRAGKGSALTFTEGDSNFTNLRDATISVTDGTTTTGIDLNGTITFAQNGLVQVGESSGTITISGNVSNDTAPALGGPLNTAGYEIRGTTGDIILNPQSNALTLNYTKWPGGDGTSGQFLKTDGAGQLTWDTVSTLTSFSVTTGPSADTSGLSYDNTTGVFTFTPNDTTGLISSVNDDNGPTLGGPLDTNSNNITSSGNADVTIAPAGTGSTVVNKINYPTEKMGANFSASGTIAPDVTDGNLQYLLLSGNITINDLTSPAVGATVTLVLDGTGGSFTGTFGSKLFFAGGAKTLTAGGLDVLTITCVDNTSSAEVYLCSLATNFS